MYVHTLVIKAVCQFMTNHCTKSSILQIAAVERHDACIIHYTNHTAHIFVLKIFCMIHFRTNYPLPCTLKLIMHMCFNSMCFEYENISTMKISQFMVLLMLDYNTCSDLLRPSSLKEGQVENTLQEYCNNKALTLMCEPPIQPRTSKMFMQLHVVLVSTRW